MFKTEVVRSKTKELEIQKEVTFSWFCVTVRLMVFSSDFLALAVGEVQLTT